MSEEGKTAVRLLAGLLTLADPDAGTDALFVHIQTRHNGYITSSRGCLLHWNEGRLEIDEFPSRAPCPAAGATIGCATRVPRQASGLSSQSGLKAPEVRQPQFAPALPAYFHTATRFHARLWQPAMGSSQAGRRGFESHLPLHVFIYLQGFEACKKPTFRGNEGKSKFRTS